MRKRDLHILTSHIFTYTGDARFSVLHPEPSDDWDLKIDYVQPRDAGVYECQINTEPKINMAVILTVEGDFLSIFFRRGQVKLFFFVNFSKDQFKLTSDFDVNGLLKCLSVRFFFFFNVFRNVVLCYINSFSR